MTYSEQQMKDAIQREREMCAKFIETMTLPKRTLYSQMNGLPLAPCEYAEAIRKRITGRMG